MGDVHQQESNILKWVKKKTHIPLVLLNIHSSAQTCPFLLSHRPTYTFLLSRGNIESPSQDVRSDKNVCCSALEFMTKLVHHIMGEAYPMHRECHAKKSCCKEKIKVHSSAERRVWKRASKKDMEKKKLMEAPSQLCLLDVIKQGWTGCSTDGWSRESSDLFPSYRWLLSPCTGDGSVAALFRTRNTQLWRLCLNWLKSI